jgi:hypothetical protein
MFVGGCGIVVVAVPEMTASITNSKSDVELHS